MSDKIDPEKEAVVTGPSLDQEIRLGVNIGERIMGEVKREWFNEAQLHKASKATREEVHGMLGQLQNFGMLLRRKEGDQVQFKVVTTKEDRDRVIREGIDLIKNDIQRLTYACARMENIIEIDPWKSLTLVR